MPICEHPSEHEASSRYFVGRSAEIERFRSLLNNWLADTESTDDAIDDPDSPSIIYISGHSGIGKSQLLHQFALIARQTQHHHLCRTAPIIDWRERNRFPTTDRAQILVEDVLDLLQRRLWMAGLVRMPRSHETEAVTSISIGNIGDNKGPIDIGPQNHFHNSIVTVNSAAEDRQTRMRRQHMHREDVFDTLCADLRQASQDQPLILCFDGYEVIDCIDQELQSLFLHAGRRILWVIAGRRNLVQGSHGSRYLGLNTLPIDLPLGALSATEVAVLVERHGQSLDQQQIIRLHQKTGGVPWILSLALTMLKQAQVQASLLSATVDSWLNVFPTVDNSISDDAIVDQMVERLLYPCVCEEDRRDLYALALVRKPFPEILQHLLETDRLRGRLQQLAERYEFVNPTTRTLEHTVVGFFRRKLLRLDDTDMPLINRLSERARRYCLDRLHAYPARQQSDQLMDDDHSDQRERWSDLLLEYLHHTLRVAPEQGTPEIIVAFCCATLYNPGLRLPLLAIIEDARPYLSATQERRLKALPHTPFWSYTDHDVNALLRLIEHLRNAPVDWHPQPSQAWNEAYAALYTLWGMTYDPSTRDGAQAKNLHTAIALYEQASRYSGTAVLNARLGQAYSHQDIRRYHDAARASLRAAQLEWDAQRQAIYYNNAGSAYFQDEALTLALECYEQALRLNPLDAVIHFNYGLVLHGLDYYQQALVAYNQALQLDATLLAVHEHRGRIYHEYQRYAEAIHDYHLALQSASASPYVYVYRAHTYRTLGHYQQALDDYNQAIQATPDDPPNYALRAMCYAYLRQFPAAFADLEHAVAYAQKSEQDFEDWITFSRAIVYSLQQQPDLALEHLERAIERNRSRSLRDIKVHWPAFAQLRANEPVFAAALDALLL